MPRLERMRGHVVRVSAAVAAASAAGSVRSTSTCDSARENGGVSGAVVTVLWYHSGQYKANSGHRKGGRT